MNQENNVVLAVLKLSRAMRRCPPPPAEHPFPPAVGRLLACVAENRRVSSRDLCEFLDLRPSSLSEMLARAESEGWITRTTDEDDRRIQRVDLSEKGEAFIAKMEEARKKDLERRTSCFTEEEKAQFCALSDRLSEHLESLAAGMPDRPFRRPRCPRRPDFPGGPGCRRDPGFPGGPGFPEEPDFPEPPVNPGKPETAAPGKTPESTEAPEGSRGRFRMPPEGRIRC